MSSLVKQSTYASVVVQLITTLLGFQGLMLQLNPEQQILKSLLLLEMVVQIVELCFYVWFVYKYKLETMAATRYFDWVITTPTMLFTTIVYMQYEELKEKKESTVFTIADFVREHTQITIYICISNFFMLLFGYLGERGILDRITALVIGFVFFGATFGLIYQKFACKSKAGKQLFAFLVIIWGLYGVAYVLPKVEQNITLNGLDILAKNFFGLFLWYKILEYSKQ